MSLFYASYYPELVYIYGETSDINSIYAHITDALAAYQQSEEVNSFSSKYDDWMQGKAIFTEAELHGMNLFENKGMCAECHIFNKDEYARRVLFTDHTYDNLGIPRNPGNASLSCACRLFSFDLG